MDGIVGVFLSVADWVVINLPEKYHLIDWNMDVIVSHC